MDYCKVLIFELHDRKYGIEIENVERIVNCLEVTKVPNSDLEIEGVAEYENTTLTVINIAKVCDISDSLKNTQEDKIVVITNEEKKLGIRVSLVKEVKQIGLDEIYELPLIVQSENTDIIKGLIKQNNEVIILLDNKSFFKRW
ncbi:MAG: chemotaxis protein CheW [Sarcina sp.]